MMNLAGFLHKHLVDTHLLLFFILYLILILLNSRWDMINKVSQLTVRLSSSKPFLIVLFLSSFLLLSFFANSVLQRSPDHIYLFQAETFQKGRLWNTPPPPDFFDFHSIVIKDNKWFSRSFPGWSFLLSIAMFVHMPTWILNPVLGSLSLFVLFLIGKLLYNKTVGLLSVVAVVGSPFFLFNASSYVPHISCGLLILLAVYLFCLFRTNLDAFFYVLLIGVCFGGAYLIRPFSTLCCFVPLMTALMIERKKEFFKKDIWWFILGISPFLLINFFYNYSITGNFLLSPFNWSDPHDTVQFKWSIILDNLDSVQNQILWMNPAVLLIYVFLVLFLSLKKKVYPYELFFFILIAGCFFYFVPGVSYGSRYYFEGYLLCVLTVIGRLSQLNNEFIKRQLKLALIAGFLISFIAILVFSIHYKHKIYSQNELYRLVEKSNLNNAVILMPTGNFSSTREARNDPDLKNKVLYAHDQGRRNILLLPYFPSRDYYRYVPDEKSEEQKLQKCAKNGSPLSLCLN